jgi:hypothetical protein
MIPKMNTITWFPLGLVMGVFRWWLMWLLSATDSSHFVSTKEKK